MAARRYPGGWDWRYMTMSTLLSPRDNPPGRLWAAAGIGLCGLAVLAWSITLRAPRKTESGTVWQPRGVGWLRFGAACMIGAGVLPLRIPRLTKGHELLTLAAFTGLCVGLLLLMLSVVGDGAHDHQPHGKRRKPVALTLATALASPIVLAGLAQLYVFYVLPELHWVGLSWRARGVPVYLSFAFWEWVTCAVLSVYLAVLGVVTSVVADEAVADPP